MKKLLSLFALLVLTALPLQAQWCCRNGCFWVCPRYYELYAASEEGIYYGYVDNINYPDASYDLPLNCRFNYCPPCRSNINCTYFKNCIEYSNKPLPPPPN